MAHDLLRKGGIPALACVASALDDALFLKCTFQVKFDQTNARATFTLRHDFYLPEGADTQSFTLIYDADNLVPTTTQCQTLARTLSERESHVVARNPTTPPNLRVLSLHLRQPCPITCPSVPSSLVSKASCDAPSQPFVDLAKSTEIEVAFDLKWITPKQVKSFTSIISQPELFHGFPVNEKNLRGQRLENWTVFRPDEEAAVSDELPSYTDVVHKRPRQREFYQRAAESLVLADCDAAVSNTPSPRAKRLFSRGSPTEKATTISPNSPEYQWCPGSPTEKATTASANSPRQRWNLGSPTEKAVIASPNTPKHRRSPGSPAEKASTASPHSSQHPWRRCRASQRSGSFHVESTHFRSRAGQSNSLRETDTNDSSHIKDVVRYVRLDALPPMLASFDLPHSDSSSSPSSTAPNTHPQSTSLRSFLTERVNKHIDKKLTTIYDDISYEANMLRQTADEEFLESVAEEKLDINMRKEDALRDFGLQTDKMLHEKLDEFSDVLDDLFEQRVEDAYDARDSNMDASRTKTMAGRLDTRAETTAVRDGRAAGERKRKSSRYRWRGRSALT
jgi:hypothetical protein